MDKLIEKYVFGCIRGLPKKMRDDVSNEIRSLISDMLDDRCGEVLPTEKDVRVVLAELGTPLELRQKYISTKNESLISGTYLYVFKRVFFLVAVVFCSVLTLGLVFYFISDGFSFEKLNWTFSSIVTGLLAAFGGTTLGFALLQHFGVDIDYTRNIDNLEAPPKSGKDPKVVSKVDSIIEIVVGILLPIVLLMFNDIAFYLETSENPGAPYVYRIINQPALLEYFYLFIISVALGIASILYSLHQRVYNKKVLIVNSVSNVIQLAIVAFILFETTVFIFGQFSGVVMGLFVLFAVIDTGSVAYKVVKYNFKATSNNK